MTTPDYAIENDLIVVLTQITETTDVTKDDILAYLDYAEHQDTKRLVRAREDKDVEIGSVGPYIATLRSRIETALQQVA